MSARRDLTGLRFGRLVALSFSHVDKHGNAHWLCVCDCGNRPTISGTGLWNGHTQSCHCLRRDAIKQALTTHGHAHVGAVSPEYRHWLRMIQRCENPRRPEFKYYGGRGIKVCSNWRNSFETYLADILAEIGPRPPGVSKNGFATYSIDRINNDGHYEPGNVRWATHSEQQRNRRKFKQKSTLPED